MREREIEQYLKNRAEQEGLFIRKVQWIARKGCPDRVIIHGGNTVWVELKAPGEKPTLLQLMEHDRMRAAGAEVWVIDSKDGVDALLDWLLRIA